VLENKIVVVTGGGGLIGRSFVSGILKHGGIAIVADIDLDSAFAFTEQLSSTYSERIEATKLDITNKESIGELISLVQNHYGKIDAVINNAYPRNKNYGRKLEDVSYADFCQNVNSHLGGYFLVAQQFCLAFKQQGFGNVINMSSIYGTMSPRFEIYDGTSMTMPVEYAAIKSAIVQLTSYFAQYFKGTGIRVNSLSPGGILAGQPDDFLKAYNGHCASKGMLAPDDLVGTLLFLLSDESRYINGQNLLVDDGFSL
jgi:NAD(P)-dependent dehydrogenase (short-subunit alcohol dehydrogenase family)